MGEAMMANVVFEGPNMFALYQQQQQQQWWTINVKDMKHGARSLKRQRRDATGHTPASRDRPHHVKAQGRNASWEGLSCSITLERKGDPTDST